MSKIPQAFIDDVLNRVDVVDIIEERVHLKKTGANYKACCPFHQEKTPSFTVSQTKQFYHCFGCGANGNAIGFLMDYEQMHFREALQYLAQRVGLSMPQLQDNRGDQAASDNSQQLYQLLARASDFYAAQLRQHADKQLAIDYLKKRGLTGQIAKRFAIGFAPTGWDNLRLHLQDSEQQLLIDAGLLIEKTGQSGYDRFRARIMFPIRDRRGRTIGFGGRVLRDDDEPKYLNSPETAVFYKGRELYGLYEALRAKRQLTRLLVVEGYMDVVMLAQHGIDYAVATLGTATTQDHWPRLLRHCKQIICCFDGDKAGRNAAWKALNTALPALDDDVNLQFMFLADGEDPDSLVQKTGREAFEQQIEQAQSLSHFLFSQLQADIDMRHLDGQTQLIHRAAPLIQQIPGNIYRYQLLSALAAQTNMSIDAIAQLTQIPLQMKSPVRHPSTNNNAGKQPTSLMQRAIGILLQQPSVAQQIEQPSHWQSSHLAGSPLLYQLIELANSSCNMSTGRLIEHWRDKPEAKLLQQLASKDWVLADDQLAIEFIATIDKLKQQENEQILANLQRQAQQQPLTAEQRQQYQKILAERQ